MAALSVLHRRTPCGPAGRRCLCGSELSSQGACGLLLERESRTAVHLIGMLRGTLLHHHRTSPRDGGLKTLRPRKRAGRSPGARHSLSRRCAGAWRSRRPAPLSAPATAGAPHRPRLHQARLVDPAPSLVAPGARAERQSVRHLTARASAGRSGAYAEGLRHLKVRIVRRAMQAQGAAEGWLHLHDRFRLRPSNAGAASGR